MTDNVNVFPSDNINSVSVATDDIGGVHYPIYKTAFGADGSQIPVSFANPLPVEALSNYYAEVVRGNITGQSRVHKFGSSVTVISSYTHVSQGSYYYAGTTAQTLTAVSSGTGAANDTAAGIGAQQITVNGLDENWAEATETIEMNGTSDTSATTTTFMRIFRAWVSRSGRYADVDNGFQSHYGEIIIANPGGEVLRIANNNDTFGAGQSECCAYTIPAGKTGLLLGYEVWVDSGKTVDFLFYQRPNADDGTDPYSGILRTVSAQVGINAPTTVYPPAPMGMFSEKTDIGMLARGASTPTVSCDFQLLLIDD